MNLPPHQGLYPHQVEVLRQMRKQDARGETPVFVHLDDFGFLQETNEVCRMQELRAIKELINRQPIPASVVAGLKCFDSDAYEDCVNHAVDGLRKAIDDAIISKLLEDDQVLREATELLSLHARRLGKSRLNFEQLCGRIGDVLLVQPMLHAGISELKSDGRYTNSFKVRMNSDGSLDEMPVEKFRFSRTYIGHCISKLFRGNPK